MCRLMGRPNSQPHADNWSFDIRTNMEIIQAWTSRQTQCADRGSRIRVLGTWNSFPIFDLQACKGQQNLGEDGQSTTPWWGSYLVGLYIKCLLIWWQLRFTFRVTSLGPSLVQASSHTMLHLDILCSGASFLYQTPASVPSYPLPCTSSCPWVAGVLALLQLQGPFEDSKDLEATLSEIGGDNEATVLCFLTDKPSFGDASTLMRSSSLHCCSCHLTQ